MKKKLLLCRFLILKKKIANVIYQYYKDHKDKYSGKEEILNLYKVNYGGSGGR